MNNLCLFLIETRIEFEIHEFELFNFCFGGFLNGGMFICNMLQCVDNRKHTFNDICINEGHKINCFQIFDKFFFSKSGKVPVEFLLVRRRKVRSKSAEA